MFRVLIQPTHRGPGWKQAGVSHQLVPVKLSMVGEVIRMYLYAAGRQVLLYFVQFFPARLN